MYLIGWLATPDIHIKTRENETIKMKSMNYIIYYQKKKILIKKNN